jgi:hypothetical protein
MLSEQTAIVWFQIWKATWPCQNGHNQSYDLTINILLKPDFGHAKLDAKSNVAGNGS